MKCNQNPATVFCGSPCGKKCSHGHPCPKKCSQRCGRCEVMVDKTLTECGHTLKLPCYSPAVYNNCTMPCMETLSDCGHPCREKCGHPCTEKCQEQVLKPWPCGHQLKRKCYQTLNPDKYPCDKSCVKKLPCEHPCHEKCGQPCTEKCQIQVTKTWPCGHEQRRRCYETQCPDQYLCERNCRRKLSCGHDCPGKCGEDCTKLVCRRIVDKTLRCGHTKKLRCSDSVGNTDKCTKRCKHILACGHRCDGECSHCSTTRIHKPCSHSVEMKQFCGHKDYVPCVGTLVLKDTHSKRQNLCVAYCAHKKCSQTHGCSTLCTRCTEPCAWNCRHHLCSKLCYEFCERPPCNKRCQYRLTCGHQCYGVCGEPCVNICPICNRKDFNVHSEQGFNPHELYVQLKCNHIFTVKFMDHSTMRYSSQQTSPVSPLMCPSCGYPLCSSYRYGNATKQSLHDVNAVRLLINKQRQGVCPRGINVEERLQTVLNTDMQEKKSKPDPAMYRNLQKAGWYTTSDRWRYRYHWSRYKPLPHMTKDIKHFQERLRHRYPHGRMSHHELYLVHLLVNTLEILSVCTAENLKSISLVEIVGTRDVNKLISTFISSLFSLMQENDSRLSIQLVRDLQSEMYLICLMVQYCLVETNLESDDLLHHCARPISALHVQQSDFQSDYSSRYGSTNAAHFASCVRECINASPPILKGSWWKCSKGHYYCSPTSTNRILCPLCE